MLPMLAQDLRYALRMLRKNPGFTAVAVLTLALGIGSNTAIFSMVDVVLLRPLPIEKPTDVVRVAEGKTKHAATWWPFTSFPSYLSYRDQNTVFSSLAAYVDRFPVNVSAAHLNADRVDAGMVTGNYFQTLGVRAEIGRTIRPEDDVPGAAPVMMLSYNYWRKLLPLDRSVLGTRLFVDGQEFTVVGVAKPGFGGVSFENLPDVWLPMAYCFQVDPLLRSEIPHQDPAFTPFGVVGRLKPGVSMAQAQAQLDVVGTQIGAGQ